MKPPRQWAGRQSLQRNTLRTLKEYPLKDITEKIISSVPIYRESSFFTWTGSISLINS